MAAAAAVFVLASAAPGAAQTDADAFLSRLAELATQAADLLDRAETINAAWDERQTGYQDTLEQLRVVEVDAALLLATVQDIDAGREFIAERDQITVAATSMSEAASAMVAGLRATDSGAARQAAVVQFREAVAGFQDLVSDVRTAATTTTSTTQAAETTTSTTSAATTTTSSTTTTTLAIVVVGEDTATVDGGGAPWALVPLGVIGGMLIGLFAGLMLGKQARVRLIDDLRAARRDE